jgi:pantothenate kinase
MDAAALAADVLTRAGDAPRFMVAVAGPPGSGKSTLADALCASIKGGGETAVVVPMDGFHLDNAILEPRGHRARKGAPHTFDAAGFVNLITRIKSREPDVYLPVFDRSIDLSRAAADVVTSSTRFIIVEGLYLLLQRDPWSRLKPLFDFSIFLDPGHDELERRLIGRWKALGKDAAFARSWMASNDFPNMETVIAESAAADVIVTKV